MDEVEIEERFARLESQVVEIMRGLDDDSENRWQVMGQLNRTLEEVRAAMRELEEWRATTDGTVRQVKTSLRAASGALMVPYGTRSR